VHQHPDGPGRLPRLERAVRRHAGMHGTYEANMAMQNCDVLIAIGAVSTTA
jgi:thiamine pyrophosphate-dependent acetolactate synthase large subunit-like protein